MYRGTFRYKGWCETLDTMKALGMLDDTVKDYREMSYAGFLAERSGLKPEKLKESITRKYRISEQVIKAFEFLGFVQQ